MFFDLHFYVFFQCETQILVHCQNAPKGFVECEFFTVNPLILIVWSSSELVAVLALAIISLSASHIKKFFGIVSNLFKTSVIALLF